MSKPTSIKLFLSHAAADVELASALVDCLLSCLDIQDVELRCTSVPGHKLPIGSNSMETIRKDLDTSAAVVGLLTPVSVNASWVLAELGAAWGAGKNIYLLLAGGMTFSSLPGPFQNIHALLVSDELGVTQMLSEIQQAIGGQLCAPTRMSRAVKTFVLIGESDDWAQGTSKVPKIIASAVLIYRRGEVRDRIEAEEMIKQNTDQLDYSWLLNLNSSEYNKYQRAMMALAISYHSKREFHGLETTLITLVAARPEGNTYAYRVLTSMRRLLLAGVSPRLFKDGGPDMKPIQEVLNHYIDLGEKDTKAVATQVKKLLEPYL